MLYTTTMSITVADAVSEVGVILHQIWCEKQWTVLLGYLTISTDIRHYEVCH